MRTDRSWRTAVALLAVVLAAPAAAQARVISAETVLPPGQSGFVPPPGQGDNPHLTDQVALFESFAFKPGGFDQPGAAESPRAGAAQPRSSSPAAGRFAVRAANRRPIAVTV